MALLRRALRQRRALRPGAARRRRTSTTASAARPSTSSPRRCTGARARATSPACSGETLAALRRPRGRGGGVPRRARRRRPGRDERLRRLPARPRPHPGGGLRPRPRRPRRRRPRPAQPRGPAPRGARRPGDGHRARGGVPRRRPALDPRRARRLSGSPSDRVDEAEELYRRAAERAAGRARTSTTAGSCATAATTSPAPRSSCAGPARSASPAPRSTSARFLFDHRPHRRGAAVLRGGAPARRPGRPGGARGRVPRAGRPVRRLSRPRCGPCQTPSRPTAPYGSGLAVVCVTYSPGDSLAEFLTSLEKATTRPVPGRARRQRLGRRRPRGRRGRGRAGRAPAHRRERRATARPPTAASRGCRPTWAGCSSPTPTSSSAPARSTRCSRPRTAGRARARSGR